MNKIYIDSKTLSYMLNVASSFCIAPIRFFSDSHNVYITAGTNDSPFCRILARVSKAHAICARCNEAANTHCRSSKEAHFYYCHAGLVEIVYPVFFEGIYAGHLTIGQFRDVTKKIPEDYLHSLADLTETDYSVLYKKYMNLPKISKEEIEGAKFILGILAKKIVDEKIFSLSNNDCIALVEQYIINHLPEKLTLDKIAANTYLNPSYLSTLFHRTTGTTISCYVQHVRNMKALYLFSNSDMPISAVAKAVGYDDANYFTKVFKNEFGCTPRAYKKGLADGSIIPGLSGLPWNGKFENAK